MNPGRGILSGALMLLLAAASARAQESAAPSALRTRWAASVDTAHPWPEYPRPQLVRPAWRNLNGWWDYAVRDSAAPAPDRYDGRILVPYPIESRLSRVQRAVTPSQRLWYHRTFVVPADWRRGRVLLHFGAVDWEAAVYVNGRRLRTHRGDYDPFTLDITGALVPAAHQQVVVAVRDPTDSGGQPRGKQVLHPRSIWYTAVTGIWQTVWLESVPSTYIAALTVTPRVDSGAVRVALRVEGAGSGGTATVEVRDGARTIGRSSGPADRALTIAIPRPRLWAPGHPFLYGLRIRLAGGDSVSSYFGMRSIALGRDSAGAVRLLLNGSPLFQLGVLDQGWWPDGLYTPPTEAGMRHDLTTVQRLGFNLLRKHVKVEPARWYYLCDSLGLLVWQDMPSGDNASDSARSEFGRELEHMVAALENHPSIVMWVPFNEGWGQHQTPRYVAWLERRDPSRLVDDASGWTDRGVGEVIDLHAYPGPGMPAPDSVRARVLGEFGGLGLPLEGHTWVGRDNWGYRTFTSLDSLNAAYRRLMGQLRILIGRGLAAAVYTQTTDVEVEVNGLMTYDREMVKLDSASIAATRRIYRPPPAVRMIVPTSEDSPQPWTYTTRRPDGEWYRAGYHAAGWQEGRGGFGTPDTPGAHVGTTWNTADIWARRTFELGAVPAAPLYLALHHDEDAEVYVNGVLVGRYPDYTVDYAYLPLPDSARAALHAGRNTLAVHVHQTKGGQFLDAGIASVADPARP